MLSFPAGSLLKKLGPLPYRDVQIYQGKKPYFRTICYIRGISRVILDLAVTLQIDLNIKEPQHLLFMYEFSINLFHCYICLLKSNVKQGSHH